MPRPDCSTFAALRLDYTGVSKLGHIHMTSNACCFAFIDKSNRFSIIIIIIIILIPAYIRPIAGLSTKKRLVNRFTNL